MHISVRVQTGAAKEKVKKIGEARYEIVVREEPERNAANKRVVELLSRHLNVPAAKVRLVSGHHKPSKLFSIDI